MIKQDEMQGGIHLHELVEQLKMSVVYKGSDYETALVGIKDVNRPALQLLGYFDYFDERRLQVIGMAETNMLENMTPEQREKSFSNLLQYPIPALIISRDLAVFPECLAMARWHKRTLLHTSDTTVVITTRVIEYLTQALAPTITRHGVLLDIAGEGVLITGDSGVGKSEAAIELIMRGHRLVADDAVELRRVSGRLMGSAPEVIRNYIELRGIGVINVQQLFGVRAVKNEAQLDLVVNFEPWDSEKFYDRLGIEDHYVDILDIQVPTLTIPVRPGRNLASIVEVAAMNNRHRKLGYNAAQELAQKVDARADGKL